MRSLTRARSERNRTDLPLLTVARERGVFVRSADDANHNAIPDDLTNYKLARRGDLVINKMKAWQGSLGLAPEDGIVSPAYYVYDFAIENRAFGQYLLRSKPYVALLAAASDGVRIGQWDLAVPRFREIPVLVPSVDEQAAIVKYLGHAHARIDRAITVKRKLIALLEEQKQAIIHQAVTRGFDESAAFSDTGDEWFPVLPTGWTATTLGRVIDSAIDGPHFSPDYVDSGVPFLSARNIRPNRWELSTQKFISQADFEAFNRRVRPAVGDVLYTKGGTTGVARVVDLPFPFQVWVHVAVLKVRRHLIEPEYLALALNSAHCYEQSQLATRGATNQDLGLSRMKRISIPLPPTLSDQRAIVKRVEASSSTTEDAIARAHREIELLREFRTRLTSDVVTGQVDVREIAATLPELSDDTFADTGEEFGELFDTELELVGADG